MNAITQQALDLSEAAALRLDAEDALTGSRDRFEMPLGPDGDLVSQPAISAHSRNPGPSTLRIALALSDRSTCCSIGPRILEELPRKSNRNPRPA